MSRPWSPQSPHDHSVLRVLQAVRAFGDAMDRMHGDMKGDMQMNATDLAALRMLIMREQRGESVSPHDVATHLRISTASTSKLLDRLTASGHVERRPHPHDRRARVIVLTEVSRRAFYHHFGERLGAMREIADSYSDDELDVIGRFLERIGHAVDPG
jgi:DNA-binding MarR family transcriptional regulator